MFFDVRLAENSLSRSLSSKRSPKMQKRRVESAKKPFALTPARSHQSFFDPDLTPKFFRTLWNGLKTGCFSRKNVIPSAQLPILLEGIIQLKYRLEGVGLIKIQPTTPPEALSYKASGDFAFYEVSEAYQKRTTLEHSSSGRTC